MVKLTPRSVFQGVPSSRYSHVEVESSSMISPAPSYDQGRHVSVASVGGWLTIHPRQATGR